MTVLFDLALAGSLAAWWVGVSLIVLAVLVLVWLATSRRRDVDVAVEAPRIFVDNAVRRHRRARRTRPVVRHAPVDERTVLISALREQTELIPTVGGGRRGR